MPKRRSAQIQKSRASMDGHTGWLFINETRHDGLDGFNWSFSTVRAVPYYSVTFDEPFPTVEMAIRDAKDSGVALRGEWLVNAPRRAA